MYGIKMTGEGRLIIIILSVYVLQPGWMDS